MGIMVKVLAISLHSGNSTFAPSGWFMHAWSHMMRVNSIIIYRARHCFTTIATADVVQSTCIIENPLICQNPSLLSQHKPLTLWEKTRDGIFHCKREFHYTRRSNV